MRPFNFIAPIFFVFLLIFFPHLVLAQPRQGPGEDPCNQAHADNWLDRAHAMLSRNFCTPAVWFDSFFGDARLADEGLPGTYVRITNAFWREEGGRVQFKSRLRASVKLPRASKRLKLILSGDTEEEVAYPRPVSPDAAGTVGGEPIDRASVALRYDLRRRPMWNTSFNLGFRSGLPLETHARLRYRYTHPIDDDNVFHFTQIVHWREWEGWGETSLVDLEHAISTDVLLRWSVIGTFSEVSSGVDWGTETSLFRQLSNRNAFGLSVGMSGVTRPDAVVENYRIGVRFRRNFHRSWLFYEVEPEVNWPRAELDRYDAIAKITFRLEVQFWTE